MKAGAGAADFSWEGLVVCDRKVCGKRQGKGSGEGWEKKEGDGDLVLLGGL